MAGFDLTDPGRVDVRLAVGGPVRLFRDRRRLDDVVVALTDLGYRVVDVEAGWLIREHMFRDLASAFSTCCHDNFDCLSDNLDDALVDTPPEAAGFAVVLRGSDGFVRSCRDDAQQLLGLLFASAWAGAVRGRPFLVLVQLDRDTVLPPLPARDTFKDW